MFTVMTNDLKTAINNLYATFAVYRHEPTMEGCPCCVSDTDKEKIHSKQLKELDGTDLSRYAFKAMTTWGNTEDFKHFLPRIYELLVSEELKIDSSAILGKLNYGKWQSWPDEEKNAIKQFLLAWWAGMTKHTPFFDKETITEIYNLTGDIDELLYYWVICLDDYSFANYIDLIYCYYSDLTGKRKAFKRMDDTAAAKMVQWIQNNSGILEQGFFRFADSDIEFAEKISTAQFIIERG